ncbi:hypothetical protein U1769_02120 [Sphingomonas sp. ZT3P38]|uniref:hypothetical protein n=1 Tax=Parasphingomonas zepuensis TaxID=3096161 RepID=UPI002FCB7241
MQVLIMASAPGQQTLTTTFEAKNDAHIATETARMVEFALKTYGSTNNVTIRITHNPDL